MKFKVTKFQHMVFWSITGGILVLMGILGAAISAPRVDNPGDTFHWIRYLLLVGIPLVLWWVGFIGFILTYPPEEG